MPCLALRLLALLLLWGWAQGLPNHWMSSLLLPVWACSSWLVFLARREQALARRRVWLAQYLRSTSWWRRRLQLGWLGQLRQLLLSLLLGLLLLLQLLVTATWFWLLLALSVPLLQWLEGVLQGRLQSHVRPGYLPVLVRRLSVWLGAGVLILVLLAGRLLSGQPWLIGLSWTEALQQQWLTLTAADGLLALLLRLSQVLDLTWLWLLQNSLGEGCSLLSLLAWMLMFGLQALFCVAWMQLLSGLSLLRPDLMQRAEESDEKH